jgi:hypothetical protein
MIFFSCMDDDDMLIFRLYHWCVLDVLYAPLSMMLSHVTCIYCFGVSYTLLGWLCCDACLDKCLLMYLLSTNARWAYYSTLPFLSLLCRVLAWRALSYWSSAHLLAEVWVPVLSAVLVSLAAHVRKYYFHVRSSICLAACLEGKYVV